MRGINGDIIVNHGTRDANHLIMRPRGRVELFVVLTIRFRGEGICSSSFSAVLGWMPTHMQTQRIVAKRVHHSPPVGWLQVDLKRRLLSKESKKGEDNVKITCIQDTNAQY